MASAASYARRLKDNGYALERLTPWRMEKGEWRKDNGERIMENECIRVPVRRNADAFTNH